MAQVPFPMRNSVLEWGKKSSRTGAMLLMHATLPFMSAYVALPRIGPIKKKSFFLGVVPTLLSPGIVGLFYVNVAI